MDFPDLMVDIETTGLDPSFNAMIQLAAVRFNQKTGAIGPIFDRCLVVPARRFWDEGTRDWWLRDKADILADIEGRAEPVEVVMKAFQDFVCDTQHPLVPTRFWAKPAHFDYSFVSSYLREYEIDVPIHYRDVVCMNSFFRGMQHDPGAAPLDWKVDFDGTEHNALDDTLHQVKVVLLAETLCATPSA